MIILNASEVMYQGISFWEYDFLDMMTTFILSLYRWFALHCDAYRIYIIAIAKQHKIMQQDVSQLDLIPRYFDETKVHIYLAFSSSDVSAVSVI